MAHLFKKKIVHKITIILLVILLSNTFINSKILYAAGAMDSAPAGTPLPNGEENPIGTGNTSTENLTSNIKDYVTQVQLEVSMQDKVKEIKSKIEEKMGITYDEAQIVYDNTYADITKIKITYTKSPNGNSYVGGTTSYTNTLTGVEINISQDELKKMLDGTYEPNEETKNSDRIVGGSEDIDLLEGKAGGIEELATGILVRPIMWLARTIGDAANYLIQKSLIANGLFESQNIIMRDKEEITELLKNPDTAVDANLPTIKVVKDYIDGLYNGNFDYELPQIKVTPAEIFAGRISALDANFFRNSTDYSKQLGGKERSIVFSLKNTIATWYVAIRNLALVGLMSVLLYIGIKIIISSNAGEKAKYKEFFMDWLIALCLIFFLHYIMAFSMTLSEKVTEVFAGTNNGSGIVKQVNIELIKKDGSTYKDGGLIDEITGNTLPIKYASNFTGVTRIKSMYENDMQALGYTVLYIALTGYTLYFTFIYLKRLLMLAFFTMIAPLVALSYPLDKMGDTKAQAFNYWLKEYIFYAFLQPLHMLLYTVFVSSTISIAANNLLFAIVTLAFIVPAEKIIKQMFGIGGKTESSIGGFAGGVMASKAFDMLGKGKGKGKSGGSGNGNGNSKIRQAKNPELNPMNTMMDDENANGSTRTNANGSTRTNANGSTRTNANGNSSGNESGNQSVEQRMLDAYDENNGFENYDPAERDRMARDAAGEPEAMNYSKDEFAQIMRDSGYDEQEIQERIANDPRYAQANTNTHQDVETPISTSMSRPRQIWNNAKRAASDRYTAAGEAKGIAKTLGKKALKGAAHGYTKAIGMGTLGAVGLGMGIVGGDMGDTLKGLSAGMVTGNMLGNKANSKIDNMSSYDGAVGSFVGETLHGGKEGLDRHRYLKEYENSTENRKRAMQELSKDGHKVSKKDLDERIKNEALMSYDSGSSNYSAISAAIKLEKDKKYSHEYLASALKLESKYSDSQLMEPGKFQNTKDRLQANLHSKGLDEANAKNQSEKMMNLIRTLRKV